MACTERTSALWTPEHAQTSLRSSLITPHSCNILHLLLLDHSLLSTPDTLEPSPMALQQKKNTYFITYACLDGLSQGSTSYDLHLDMVHALCNQAEGRKVSCNAKTVSVYRKRFIYTWLIGRKRSVWGLLANEDKVQVKNTRLQGFCLLSCILWPLAIYLPF